MEVVEVVVIVVGLFDDTGLTVVQGGGVTTVNDADVVPTGGFELELGMGSVTIVNVGRVNV